MKLKAVFMHLLFASSGASFMLQANLFVIQKSTMKTGIDPQIGNDSKKRPPGIKELLIWPI